jgi:hypothetical protein
LKVGGLIMVAITTIDNPYDPFEEFTKWFLYDVEKGYNTCAYLDRVALTCPSFTDEENQEEIEKAIDDIINADFMHIYKKVYSDTPSPQRDT